MVQHTFSKTGYSTVTLSVAPSFPYSRRVQPRQRVGRNEAGTVQVGTLGTPDTFYELRFESLPAADVSALEAFFDALKWQADTFIWTDHDATARPARLWDTDLAISQLAPDCFDVTLHLLVAGS
jgi:hypothetical protein